MPLGVALTLVWLAAGVTEAHQEESYLVSSSGSQDILLLGQPRSTGRLLADWPPVGMVDEAERELLQEKIHQILGRYPRFIDPEQRECLAQTLVMEGRRTGIDPIFLAALIRVESAFFSGAVSKKGARGLMQLMPATGEEVARQLGLAWHGPHQLHDPEINVRLGVAYLENLLDYYAGNYRFALTAYNRGPGNVRHIVRRHGSLTQEFTAYFRTIQRFYRVYLNTLGDSMDRRPQV